MQVRVIRTPIFKAGDNLPAFIYKNIKSLKENSVLVVTSKILALAQNRVVEIKTKKEKENLIKLESQWTLKAKKRIFSIKDNMLMTSAGIDHSNANGYTILLPQDVFKSARLLRNKLKRHYNVKNLGIIISDSRTRPFRAGISGIAMAYAGFNGLDDRRGQEDIFGRKLHYTRVNAADSLAATAVLLMGEGKEKKPLALISGAPVKFNNQNTQIDLTVRPQDDIYYPVFENIRKIKLK